MKKRWNLHFNSSKCAPERENVSSATIEVKNFNVFSLNLNVKNVIFIIFSFLYQEKYIQNSNLMKKSWIFTFESFRARIAKHCVQPALHHVAEPLSVIQLNLICKEYWTLRPVWTVDVCNKINRMDTKSQYSVFYEQERTRRYFLFMYGKI